MPFLTKPRLFVRRPVWDEQKDWAYVLTLLKRASDYLNGEVSLSHVQVAHLAATLKTVLAQVEKGVPCDRNTK